MGKKIGSQHCEKRSEKKENLYRSFHFLFHDTHLFDEGSGGKNHHTILYLHIERASRPMLERCLVRSNGRETECKCAKAWL